LIYHLKELEPIRPRLIHCSCEGNIYVALYHKKSLAKMQGFNLS